MRILMITEKFPFPPDDGVKLKVYNLLKCLSKKHKIHLVSFIRENEKITFGDIESFCVDIELITKKPRTWIFFKVILNIFEKYPFSLKPYTSMRIKGELEEIVSQNNFDIIHFDMANMAQFYNVAKNIPTFMTPNDSISTIEKMRAKNEVSLFRKVYRSIQSKKWARFESQQYIKFDKCSVVSEYDKQALLSLNPRIDIDVVPNGVDVHYFKPMHLDSIYPSIVFTGAMNSFQSYDAVQYFYKNIYSEIKEEFPEIKFFIVGKTPHSSINRLRSDKSVIVTGYVDDIRSFIDKCTVYICPIRTGSGIKNRLLEAMSMGKPIVSLRRCCETLNVKHMKNILIADNPDQFSSAVIKLLKNEQLRQQLSLGARKHVENFYSWDKTASLFDRCYLDAINKKRQKE